MDEEQGAGRSGLDRLASVNLNLFVPLLALLEERSVTKAAARVGMTQPAMSHALARMRRLLGDDLVVRHGSGLRLTPRALELIVPLRSALRQAAELVNFPGFDAASDARVITIAMMTTTAFVVGPPLAGLLAERAPNATLRIRTITVPTEAAFTDEGVDVVLLSDAFYSPYPRERLYDDRWVVIASPDTPPASDSLELITDYPHVVFDADRRVLPYTLLAEHGISFAVAQLVSDNLLAAQLVARSSGVVGFQRLRVASAVQAQLGLRIEEMPIATHPVGIDMVWNPRLSDQYFIEWLRGLLFEVATDLRQATPGDPGIS